VDGTDARFFDEGEEPDDDSRELSNCVIGACIAVHRELGPGYLESFYERALEIEFRRRGVVFRRQVPFEVKYAGEVIGSGRIDFLIEERLILELKHVDSLASVFTATMISYLKATGLRLGLIVNFKVRLLKDGIKRIVL
jgi:GxxExxY protein